MTARRDVWRQYALAADRVGVPVVSEHADAMLAAEEERFGKLSRVDSTHEELRAQLLAAERELDSAQADNVLLNERVDTLERELAEARAQLAGAVPIAELRHLLALCEAYARGDGDVTRDVLDALREFVAIVERRAGEKEGG